MSSIDPRLTVALLCQQPNPNGQTFATEGRLIRDQTIGQTESMTRTFDTAIAPPKQTSTSAEKERGRP